MLSSGRLDTGVYTLTTGFVSEPKAVRLQTGVTLVELLVVVTILGVIASLAAPAFNGAIARWQIAGFASDVKNALMSARAAAASTGRRVSVITGAGGWQGGLTVCTVTTASLDKCVGTPIARFGPWPGTHRVCTDSSTALSGGVSFRPDGFPVGLGGAIVGEAWVRASHALSGGNADDAIETIYLGAGGHVDRVVQHGQQQGGALCP